jgi:RiboL-PSP-HEPN
MRNQLKEEFQQNTNRVQNLISAFNLLEENNIGDLETRKDILRAAVVFMHGTLEEIVRNLYIGLLPNCHQDKLNEIPFVGHAVIRPKGILLGHLKDFSGRFIENIILDSIESYVNTMNLNNATQLCNSLKLVELPTESLVQYFSQLGSLMERRHQIVHQMDRKNEFDLLLSPVTDIEIETVFDWQNALHSFFLDLLQLLPIDNESEIDLIDR